MGHPFRLYILCRKLTFLTITCKEVSAYVHVMYIGTGMYMCLSNYMYMHLVPLDLFT